MEKVAFFIISLCMVHCMSFRLDKNSVSDHQIHVKALEDESTTEDVPTDMTSTDDESNPRQTPARKKKKGLLLPSTVDESFLCHFLINQEI